MSIKTKLLATLACILWGSAFAGAKYGFAFMPPILLSGMRFMLAGLILLPLLLKQGVPIISSIIDNWKFMSLFALMQTFLQYGLFYMGLDKVSASSSAIIIGAGPLFIMVMAHFTMKEDKITWPKISALALALVGVLFIALTKGGETVADNSVFYLGLALLISSNLVGSYTNIMVAKYKRPLSPILLTAYANFSGGFALLLTGLGVEQMPQLSTLPLNFYLSLIWLAIIPAAGFSIWYSLLQTKGVKVSDLNMWKFIIPMSGCALSWILLSGERANIYSITGIAIITTALIIYNKAVKD